jgi:hypothetical protein
MAGHRAVAHTFRTAVELGGKTATGLRVPDAVVAALGSGRRPAVTITVHGHTYRSTVASMGGAFWVPLNAANRTAAGVAAGDEVEVTVAPDTEPRTVAVPDDLAAALAAEPGARDRFDALSFTRRKEHVLAVEGAKAAATRARRIDPVVRGLSQG